MVREFYYDEKELKCEKEELMKLASDKKQQYVSSTLWVGGHIVAAFATSMSKHEFLSQKCLMVPTLWWAPFSPWNWGMEK